MKKIITLAAVLLLLSCNNNGNKTDQTSGNKDSQTSHRPGESEPEPGAPGAIITVTLKGGANAGSYSARSAEPTCSEGLTGENSFGNQYSVKGKADNELSSLQLIIDDKDAAKKETDKFSLSVGFGKLLGGKIYEVNTRDNSKEGSGKATLTESSGTRTVVVEGKTADGVSISATIKCHRVITAG